MSDRLADLQRQRALAQGQVAWLDREIVRETQQVAAAGQTLTPAVVSKPVVSTTSDQAGEEILAQYRQNPLTTEKGVKRGCYLYFAFAMVGVALFALGVYLIYSRK